MSSFKDHPWALSYKTSGLKKVSILHDFYIPALKRAEKYDRVAGYFRSSSLAAASQGFSAFVGRGGKMRLIAGADLAEQDVEAILQGEASRLAVKLSDELGEPDDPRTEAETWGVAMLAKLVELGVLEVKVALRVHTEMRHALPVDSIEDGYVHEKWAVLTDGQGHRLYVSGSLNESKTALKINAENIDVHCDWKSEEARLRADEAQEDFESLWADEHPAFRVLPIPDAVREQLVRFAGRLPPRPTEIDGTSAAPLDLKLSAEEWLRFAFLKDAPRMPNGQYLGIETAPIEAWPHQRIVARRLVDSWPLSWMMCDEVGLGKTIETGLALRSLYLAGRIQRVLIAAPASVAPQWQREMADKFFLPFRRPVTNGKLRHKVLFPFEEEESATSVFAPDLNIVSTGLLIREGRQQDLKASGNWDVVLLDEAHYARRSNPTNWADRPPEWNKLFKATREILRDKAESLWLATATPVQIEPIEAIDLASLTRRLGPFGLEPQVALGYYELLGKLRRGSNLDDLEWYFLGRVVQHIRKHDSAVSSFIDKTLLRGRDRRDLERWLSTLESSPGEPPAPARKAVTRLLFATAPLSRVMMRHNRGLLLKYREHGKLAGNLATRTVHLPTIELNPAEKALYDLFEPYCQALAEQVATHSQQRTAIGFMLSFFHLRFASSYKAILDTLTRRREKVATAIEHQHNQPEPTEDDWEELVDDESDEAEDEVTNAGLLTRSPTDLKWELGELDKLIDQLTPLAQKQSPKVRTLLNLMQGRQLPNGRVRQMVVFTRFYDTLTDIQSWIERSATSVRIGIFSGPRCAYMDPESLAWKGSNREEVKRRFIAGDIDVLLCTDAAAEGLNLQTADLLVNFDLPWNPMKVEQRIGRIDRIGQRHDKIHVANFAYPGTAEEEVYVRLQSRIAGAAGTVGAQQVIVLPVFPSDLRKLSTGELSRDKLEALVRERLKQAKERAEAMELTPEELYVLYQNLDEELTKQPLPVTLEQIFATLENSAYLKAIGCEVLESAYGKALLVNGIAGEEPSLLTTSRELFERGFAGRNEPLHFATWGDPVFDGLLEHVIQSIDMPVGARRIQAPAGNNTSLVGWLASGEHGDILVTQYAQLSMTNPDKPLPEDKLASPELGALAAIASQGMEEINKVEKASAVAAGIHRKTHLMVAAKLVAVAPSGSTLADLGGLLPDGTRTLKSGKLESVAVHAERLHGLLQGTENSVFLPRFYQPFLVSTLRKERLALKKARKGTDEDQIPLSELAERLMREAQRVSN